MRARRLTVLLGAAAIALAAAAVRADVYTWLDASGRVNISNLEPPSGAKVTKVTHTAAPVTTPEQEATRLAAVRAAEVEALEKRVRELEIEAEVARRVAAATPPPAPAAPIIVQAPAPAMPYYDAPPPQTVFSSYSTPPSYGCDPGWFGCNYWWPGFYPSSVVVVNQPRRHFQSHRRDNGGGFQWKPIMLPHDGRRR